MPDPCIVCVAITGSVPTKDNNPAVPITVAEQIESTHEAFEAGAAIVHCHVRNDDQTPSSDPEKFGRLLEGLRKHCPGLIVQLSTGGRSGAGKARLAVHGHDLVAKSWKHGQGAAGRSIRLFSWTPAIVPRARNI